MEYFNIITNYAKLRSENMGKEGKGNRYGCIIYPMMLKLPYIPEWNNTGRIAHLVRYISSYSGYAVHQGNAYAIYGKNKNKYKFLSY